MPDLNMPATAYQSMSEDNAELSQSRRPFNSDDAEYCFKLNVKVGAAIGAVVGAAASLAFFGSKFLASGASCPTNPIDPCDGKGGALLLGCMMIPGAAVGGAGGAGVGVVTGAASAPFAGFFGVPRMCDDRVAPNVRTNNNADAQADAPAPARLSMA
jgi:hypothetical protein